MAHPLLPVGPDVRALASTLCPAARRLDDHGWARAEAIIDRALRARPPSVPRQLRLFVWLIAGPLARLRHRRRFRDLDDEVRTRYLRSLERSRLLLLRRGLWGVRTLVFMGVYGQTEVRDHIGFRARPGGWAAREADPR